MLVLLVAGIAAEPDWKASELPLSLSGLSIGSSVQRARERLGAPERELDSDLKLYPGGLLVRTKEGRIVNLTASGAWTLRQGERDLMETGQPVPASLGQPGWRYRRRDLQVWLFPVRTADLGVLMQGGSVQGFLLSEPGLLGWALEQSGYVQEDPSVPSP